MKRTVTRVARKDNGYPMCEICKNSCGCRLEPPTCDYDITDREDLKNRIFYAVTMNTRGQSETYPSEVIKEMNLRFLNVYNGKAFEIYNMNFENEVCPTCDGSGVIIGPEHISTCKKCEGDGIIKIPVKPGFIKAYMVYDAEPKSFEISEVLGIYKTRDQAERAYKIIFGKDATDSKNHIGETFISKHLDTDEMWQSFYRLFDGIRECKVTVLDTTKNQIVYAGITWKQFWHNGFGLELIDTSSEYHDLDAMTNGRFIIVPQPEFEKQYQTHDNQFMDELFAAQFSNVVSTYLPYVSYGNTAYDLIDKYMEKFPDIDSIRNNLILHISAEINDESNYIVGDGDMVKLRKIIKDFKLIGMDISNMDAIMVIRLVQKLLPAVDTLIDKFNMVAVFLAEYVIISAEYANITD